ncbi:MAG: FAD-binding oxidoreductase [Candidatus Helarchaeota archaeon]|nr:FAD-binding oxidoreductase [Candidatus Helarchaeota archaeon]
MKVINRIKEIVGSEYASDADFVLQSYSKQIAGGFRDKRPDLVVRPKSVEEISEILKYANAEKISVIPRGGGAGFYGGVLPLKSGGIVIDMTRMDNILNFNENTMTITVQCGITWAQLNDFLFQQGFYTGTLGPGSGMSAVIGGSLSHHSVGGGGAAKYGAVTRHCVGLKVVLANGDIITTGSGASKYIKEPFSRWGLGPDLTSLFLGDQGIMGIKAEATLLVYPKPEFRSYRTFTVKKRTVKTITQILMDYRKNGDLGLYDAYWLPELVIQGGMRLLFVKEFSVFKLFEESNPKGRDVFFYTCEADSEAELEQNVKKLNELALQNKGVEMLGTEIEEGNIAKWHYEKNGHWQIYHGFWGLAGPGSIPQSSEHHVPIHQIPKMMDVLTQWEAEKQELMVKVKAVQGLGSALLCDHTTVELDSGLIVWNNPEYGEINEQLLKSNLEMVIKSGGMPYMAGMYFSRALIDANAFLDPYYNFMKAVKHALDPNGIISPGKFYLGGGQ